MSIDWNSDVGQRAQERLANEQDIWLTTTGSDGTPQPRPVWFLWDGATLLIYSQPEAAKLKHIARNPRVALHFNSDGDGGDIVVITGIAEVDPNAPRSDAIAAYVDKYRKGISDIGMTPETLSDTFSTAIRVTPTSLRGFK